MALTQAKIRGVARGIVSDVSNATEEGRADWALLGRYLTKQFGHTEVGTNVNLAESPVWAAKYAGNVLRASVMPAVNVAVNTSNYVYLALSKSTGGASSTVVAYLNTAVTALTKNVRTAFTLNVNGNTYAADDVLTLAVTKYIANGTADVSMTAATSKCTFQMEFEEGY